MKKTIMLMLCLIMMATALIGCAPKVSTSTDASDTEESTAADTTEETADTEEVADTAEEEMEAADTEDAEAAPEVGDVATGYYNLADFEAATGKELTEFHQAPMLDDKDLPPVEERLPENPLVLRTLDAVGVYGGTMRTTSMNVDQEWHLRHINAANLIEMPASPSWDAVSTIFGAERQPGVLEAFGMNEDGTVFTATIRKGLKWSDGVAVTTEDVRFLFEDVFLNETLYPSPPTFMTWGGGETVFEIADDYTFSLTFAEPYGGFIESEIGMWPAVYSRIMIPSHYMKQYHLDYADEADVLAMMEAQEYTSIDEWASFFSDKRDMYGCDYIGMDDGKVFPVLDPWQTVEDLGNGNYLLERNPYYYMIDQDGNQLPYIDKIKRSYVTEAEMLNMAIISGDVDISAMALNIEEFPLYKENEANGNYVAMPLSAWQDQIVNFNFNMYHEDDGLKEVYGDVRFRRAMSLALDRETMAETMYLGMARPAQVAPRPGTPFYEEGMEEAYVEYDPEGAKALLDEMGMVDIDGDGWRERPDGEQYVMKYEYFVITQASITGSEFAKRYWEDVGVRVEVKQVDVGYWWGSLQPTNEQEATCWWLAGSGGNLVQPWFLVPSMITPEWWDYTNLKDTATEEEWEAILAKVPEWQQEMQDSRLALLAATSEADRIKYGTRMWELQAEWLPTIGVATDIASPFIISADISNVEMAVEENYNYITMMEHAEQFYFSNPDRLSD